MNLKNCCPRNENGEETYYSNGQWICGYCGATMEDDHDDEEEYEEEQKNQDNDKYI